MLVVQTEAGILFESVLEENYWQIEVGVLR